MQLNERLQNAVNFMENYLKEGISIKDIADRAYFSIYYFQRLFKAISGYSVMAYLRRRRLAKVAEELSIQERRVIDLALEFQFASEPSLIRSFRESFGVTPGNFKRNTHPLWITPRLNLQTKFPKVGKMQFQPRKTLFGKASYLYFVEHQNESLACRLKAEYLDKTYPQFKLVSDNPVLFSLCRFSEQDPQGMEFFLGFSEDEVKSCPIDLERVEIPAHYQFVSQDRIDKSIDHLRTEDLSSTFNDIYQYTLPHSAYNNIDAFSYTCLNVDENLKRNIDYSLHIPVMEKA